MSVDEPPPLSPARLAPAGNPLAPSRPAAEILAPPPSSGFSVSRHEGALGMLEAAMARVASRVKGVETPGLRRMLLEVLHESDEVRKDEGPEAAWRFVVRECTSIIKADETDEEAVRDLTVVADKLSQAVSRANKDQAADGISRNQAERFINRVRTILAHTLGSQEAAERITVRALATLDRVSLPLSAQVDRTLEAAASPAERAG